MRRADNCLVNALHIVTARIGASQTNKPPTLEADYTLVHHRIDKRTGAPIDTPHGKLTAGSDAWSRDTLACMSELLTLMEQDLIGRHFEGDGEGAEEHARNFIGGHETPPQV